jgi:hypothetical protein
MENTFPTVSGISQPPVDRCRLSGPGTVLLSESRVSTSDSGVLDNPSASGEWLAAQSLMMRGVQARLAAGVNA